MYCSRVFALNLKITQLTRTIGFYANPFTGTQQKKWLIKIRALPSDDLFFLACPFSWQAAKWWRAWLLPQFLHPSLSSDGKGGEFIALIWSKMLPSVGVLAYFSSMKTLSWSWKLLSSLLFAFNHSSKSSRIASSTASMLRPGEQIVTEGKLSSDTGLAGSWVKQSFVKKAFQMQCVKF